MRTFIEHRYREIDTRLTILTIQARAYLSLAGVLSLEYVLSGGAGQFLTLRTYLKSGKFVPLESPMHARFLAILVRGAYIDTDRSV